MAGEPLKIALVGPGGRMGRAILEQLEGRDDMCLSGALVRAGSALEGQKLPGQEIQATSDPEQALAAAGVMLDFSRPETIPWLAPKCAQAGVALVSGTTGLGGNAQDALKAAADQIPVLYAPNTSLGVNLLAGLVRRAAAVLGEDYDIEITEAHHRHKVDAPSGTALRLGEAAAAGRGVDPQARAVHSRHGHTGPRQSGDIGYAVVRGGDIAGEHSVLFAGPGERLELGHRASSRATFAAGALHCATWIAGQSAGLYSMDDVLDLGPY